MNKYKIEVKWAFAFVIMQLLWMLLEKILGLHSQNIDKHPIYTNFVAIPSIAIYMFALLDKRNNYFQGTMTYKEGLITGVIITFIVTLFSPLTQLIVSNIITPEYFPNVIKHSVNTGLMTEVEALNFFNLNSYIKQAIIVTPIMGMITTIIVAFLIKKKNS